MRRNEGNTREVPVVEFEIPAVSESVVSVSSMMMAGENWFSSGSYACMNLGREPALHDFELLVGTYGSQIRSTAPLQ